MPDWQSAALPFVVEDVLAQAVTHSAVMQSCATSSAMGRLRLPAQNIAVFIFENAAMPLDLSLATIRLGHFLPILNLTAPALNLEDAGKEPPPQANLFPPSESLDMSNF